MLVVGRIDVSSICDGWVRFVICGCGFDLGWFFFFFSLLWTGGRWWWWLWVWLMVEVVVDLWVQFGFFFFFFFFFVVVDWWLVVVVVVVGVVDGRGGCGFVGSI